jgi:hypothetical protein
MTFDRYELSVSEDVRLKNDRLNTTPRRKCNPVQRYATARNVTQPGGQNAKQTRWNIRAHWGNPPTRSKGIFQKRTQFVSI